MKIHEFASIVHELHCRRLDPRMIRAAWLANVPPEKVGEWLDHPERFP